MKGPFLVTGLAVGIVLLGSVLLILFLRGTADSENGDGFEAGSMDRDVHIVHVPEDVSDPAMLERRAELQLASTDQLDVYHSFGYADQREASGIRFRHRIVDDVGIHFKNVHYDHGNGISVADVDSDGLLDIYFTNQIGSNELWRNLGDGVFEDITHEAGVGMDMPVSVASSFADIDNDGDADLFVTTVRFGNVLFENDGTGRFRDISRSAGLDHVGHSSGAVFFDFDKDGLLDLFLTNVGKYTTDRVVPMRGDTPTGSEETYSYYEGIGNDEAFKGHLIPARYEQNILYRNEGDNRFTDVSEEVGLVDSSWSGDATSFDGNGDGWPDLYILSMQGHDVYFENVDGTRFVDKTASRFRRTPWGAMGAKVLDYNNDGKLDLYVTDMHSDMWETNEVMFAGREKEKPRRIPSADYLGTSGSNIFGNALFRNGGEGFFTDVAEFTRAETYWPWGVSSGDLNADGYEDLFVSSSMNYPYRYAVNKVLLNNRGSQFHDSEFIVGVEPRKDERMTQRWFDVDCSEMMHEHCPESGTSQVIEVHGSVGTRSSVIFDLEADGDLDIVTNEFNSLPMVLVSDLSERKDNLRYLQLDLVGTESNRDGLGAVVRVITSSFTITKVHDGKSGYLSQSSAPLYFGVGEDDVDRIEVTWPSGRQQSIEGEIEMNTTIRVVEP